MRPRCVLVLLTVIGILAESGAVGGPLLHAPAHQAGRQVAPEANPWRAPDLYDDQTEGVTNPTVLRELKPSYTSGALRTRIEGLVLLECIVELDGTVGAIRVRHSLDSVNGLDDESIRVLRQWRFAPGTKDGKSVRSRL